MFSLPKLYTNAIAILIFLPMFLDVLVWAVDRERKVLFEIAAEGGENTWKKVQSQDPKLTSRELFTYALALYEAGKYLERVPILMETAARMQDRNSESRTYGNFLWYSDEHSIRDLNAVEFCMMAGAHQKAQHLRPFWVARPEYEPHAEKLPILMQDHGVAVRYRNIWASFSPKSAADLLQNLYRPIFAAISTLGGNYFPGPV